MSGSKRGTIATSLGCGVRAAGIIGILGIAYETQAAATPPPLFRLSCSIALRLAAKDENHIRSCLARLRVNKIWCLCVPCRARCHGWRGLRRARLRVAGALLALTGGWQQQARSPNDKADQGASSSLAALEEGVLELTLLEGTAGHPGLGEAAHSGHDESPLAMP
ncbi:hypothetical protein E2C01_074782 [Portunus trituberculatus]|uniref:Uncharacterized protein n=1 Tax=Portunus trituberculatus TaxID=210409 RepID=A0A5B7IEE0_PORTR|nr:hypothetical protein [Portunus trituberculatus]